MENTRSIFVKINGITDATELVRQASKVRGDIYVKRGVYCVDGKSIMGIMSIDLSQGVTIVYPGSAEEFEQFIAQYRA